jgi:predicted RNase H-like nuclease
VLAVGVDGYPRGWVAVVLLDGSFSAATVHRTFADVLAAHGEAAAVGVDIPIGLPEGGVRAADRLARALVGPRRGSVFWTPPRAALAARSHFEAVALCREVDAPGVSAHAYALRGKLLEVDGLVAAGDRVVEVHPEVSFRALAGQPLALAKSSWGGFALRRRLLAGAGVELPDELGPAGLAGPDDVLDAAAAAWSADRVARGVADTLPGAPERDERGRPVAIWY